MNNKLKAVSNKQLQSSRLLLKPLDETVLEDVYHNFTDEVIKYMFPAAPTKIEQSLEFINAMQKCRAQLMDFVYSIHRKEDGQFIGCAGLHQLDQAIPELGIWTKVSAHGNGYGKEAILALIELAKELGYDSLKYPVDYRNIASKKIPLSLGATLVKEHKIIKTPDGRELDEEIYHIKL